VSLICENQHNGSANMVAKKNKRKKEKRKEKKEKKKRRNKT
jgi:hypothetical protein